MNMKIAQGAHKTRLHLPLAALAILAACLLLVTACGGGDSLPSGPLGLVPDDSSSVTVMDVEQILKGDGPDAIVDRLEDLEDDVDVIGVDVNDLTTLVYANRLLIMEGDIDFEEVRDELDDADYDDDRYQGHEFWEQGRLWVESAALLEDRNQIVIGDVDAVKDVLKALNRGSGSLLDDADSDLGRALKRAGGGWVVSARKECRSYDVRGCNAIGTAIHKGDEDYVVQFTAAYLFRNERTAESEMGDLEDEIDDSLSRDFDIEEVRQDGEFVIVTISVDEDDWDTLDFP